MKNLFVIILLTTCFGIASAQTYVTQVKPSGSKKWGYANLKGELIIPAQYDNCYEFTKDGFAPVFESKGRQYQFINLKGEKLNTEVKEFKLINGSISGFGAQLKGFEDGLVPIKNGDNWGYLNTAGKLAIPAKYEYVTDFSGGHASVKSGGKYFIIDTKGTEVPVAAAATDVKHFSESLAPYRAADNTFGFIDESGNVAIPAQFEGVGYFHDGLAWAKANKMIGFIDKKGSWVIEPSFAVGKDFDPSTGLARIKKDDRWGYVSKSGEIKHIDDTEIWEDFSNGLARGRKNKKFGFLNSKGEWVIAPQFDGSRDFKNGYAAVEKDNKWGIIDTSGKWIIQPTFDGIRDMELVK
jgi:hypothetical protein